MSQTTFVSLSCCVLLSVAAAAHAQVVPIDGQTKQCRPWPENPCRFDLRLHQITNLDGPFGDESSEYSFAFRAFGQWWSEWFSSVGSLPEGATGVVDRTFRSVLVGCGETLTVPLRIAGTEWDGGFFWSPNENGWLETELDLECLPGQPVEHHLYDMTMAGPGGVVKHKARIDVDVRRTDVDACTPAITADIGGGFCDVAVYLERVHHRLESTDDNHGEFRFDVTVAGTHVAEPDPDFWVREWIDQGRDWWARDFITTVRVPCGEKRYLPVSVHGAEFDFIGADEGSAQGTLEVGCPQEQARTSLRLDLRDKFSHRLEHVVDLHFMRRDEDWSKYRVAGENECCSATLCKSECPVIGDFDGEQCLVATAPPGAHPFLWSNNPFLQGLYITPLMAAPQCPVGSFDSLNCHVASIASESATAFVEGDSLYVAQCDPLCPSACPYLGEFDGANCLVGEPPAGATASISNGDYSYGAFGNNPATACPVGSWVSPGRCRWQAVPPSVQPFVYQNRYYARACVP